MEIMKMRHKMVKKHSKGCGAFNIKRAYKNRMKMERENLARVIQKKQD